LLIGKWGYETEKIAEVAQNIDSYFYDYYWHFAIFSGYYY